MQIKNQINSEGNRDGYWEKYYLNGVAGYKGNYINGKEDGYWEWYFENDMLWFKGNYKNGKRVGYWEYYNEDGSLRANCYYAN